MPRRQRRHTHRAAIQQQIEENQPDDEDYLEQQRLAQEWEDQLEFYLDWTEDMLNNHEHQWGPLEQSRIAATVHRKCQIAGCKMILAADEFDEMEAEDDAVLPLSDEEVQHLLDSIHTDVQYATRQLRNFSDMERALDALDRIVENQQRVLAYWRAKCGNTRS
jgi:hypothetical protein